MSEENKPLKIISMLYFEHDQQQAPDMTLKFSISLDGPTLSFYDAVAQELNTTRSRLLSGLLEDNIMPTLLSLTEGDQDAVLQKADDNTRLFYKNVDGKKYPFEHTRWSALAQTLKEQKDDENA
jgi:hypothetical protein